MEVVENGIEKAVAAVRGKKQVLLALGCNSVINAKEEIDRNTLELPEEQEMLLDRIAEVNPNTVLVLFTCWFSAAALRKGSAPRAENPESIRPRPALHPRPRICAAAPPQGQAGPAGLNTCLWICNFE